MDAARAFINTWLKDKRFYCNYCGKGFKPHNKDEKGYWIPCCDNPQIGRNKDHTQGVINQNRGIRETRKNDFAAFDDDSMRMGLSMPPSLLRDLESYFAESYKEKLFVDNSEMHKFMKEFPEFTTCRRI